MLDTKESLQFGDIVLITYPSSSQALTQNRPCLVLHQDEENVLVSFISSRLETKTDEDVPLKKDPKNHLATDSLLKTKKITNIKHQLIYKKLGTLAENDKQAAKKKFIELMNAL